MKAFAKLSLTLALVGCILLPTATIRTSAAEPKAVSSSATGYTCAEDVDYVYHNNYIANWGARGEACTFLSTPAQSFYTGSYVYETLSQKSGSASQSNVPSSALYTSLKQLMESKHSHTTSYGETKEQYRYTDCVKSDYAHISSFYSGKELTGNWDSAATWNREHTWPDSKGLNGSDENDIMMLRPTWVQENSSRGNTAYGISSGYFNPDCENPPASVKGDCARIVLYVYTRWGNTQKMWEKQGVIESVSVLLQWMAEDPVDTWEMGRNDAVQSITGTRNVFVDYPEYAWLLFGKSVPTNVSTPSKSNQTTTPPDESTDPPSGGTPTVPDSSTDTPSGGTPTVPDGSTGNGSGSTPPPNSSTDSSTDTCEHEYGVWHDVKKPTETTDGERHRFCKLCGELDIEIVPKTGSPTDTSSGCASSITLPIASVFAATAFVLVLRKKENE